MNEYENHFDAVIENGPRCEAGSGAGGVNRRVFKGPYGWMVEDFIPKKKAGSGRYQPDLGRLVTTMKRHDNRILCNVTAAHLEAGGCFRTMRSWGPSTVLYTAPDGTRATRAAIVAAHAEGLKQLQNGEGK